MGVLVARAAAETASVPARTWATISGRPDASTARAAATVLGETLNSSAASLIVSGFEACKFASCSMPSRIGLAPPCANVAISAAAIAAWDAFKCRRILLAETTNLHADGKSPSNG
jgi:hypothetical protein